MNDNILLAGDDPRTIQILARILAQYGNLRFATNSPEALSLARESVPELVLLDADMPGLSGFEVCKAMKMRIRVAFSWTRWNDIHRPRPWSWGRRASVSARR